MIENFRRLKGFLAAAGTISACAIAPAPLGPEALGPSELRGPKVAAVADDSSQVEVGELNVRILWPNRSLPTFKAQAIPHRTNSIRLTTLDNNGVVVDKRLVHREQSTSEVVTSFVLPAGQYYSLKAEAFAEVLPSEDSNPIAQGIAAKVQILKSKKTSVGIRLTALQAPAIASFEPVGAAVGDTVSLIGENLGQIGEFPPVVSFNGATASIVFPVTGSSLKAVVPTGATVGPIVVEIDGIRSQSTAVFWPASTVSIGASKNYWDSSRANNRSILFGGNLQCNAIVSWLFDNQGDRYGQHPGVDWILSNTIVGSIDREGLFSAGSSFSTASVIARVGSLESNSLDLTIEGVESFDLSPATASIGNGSSDEVRLVPVNRMSSGATNSAAIFESSSPASVSVSTDGLARLVDPNNDGSVVISAVSKLKGSLTSTATLNVLHYPYLASFRSLTGSSLINAREDHSAFLVNQSLYAVAGAKPGDPLARLNSTEGAPVIDGIPGAFEVIPKILDGWTGFSGHATLQMKNSVYFFGGIFGNMVSDIVIRIPTNASGLGSATSGPAESGGRMMFSARGHSVVRVGDYIYVIGGQQGSTQRAHVNSDESLGPFESYPIKGIYDYEATTISVGQWVYAIGGGGVRRAAVGGDGSLGDFQAAPGIDLRIGRSNHSVLRVGRYIYIIGGEGTNGSLGSIERAVIGSDGSLSDFELIQETLGTPCSRHTSTIAGNSAIVLGGRCQDQSVTVQRALIK